MNMHVKLMYVRMSSFFILNIDNAIQIYRYTLFQAYFGYSCGHSNANETQIRAGYLPYVWHFFKV